MKTFKRSLHAVFLGALGQGALSSAAEPNIVLFFSDDHTQQVISAYQDLPNAKLQDLTLKDWAPSRTPNLDRLAANGVVFSNSYVSNSLCGPSRANLMTGLHSHANGFTSNRGEVFDGGQQNFAKLLGQAGYRTALFGKWHLVSEPTGFDHYERLVGQGAYYSPVLRTTLPGGGRRDVNYPGRYVSEVLTEQALDWLGDYDSENTDEPFLLMLNHKATHRVWQPSPIELQPEVFRQVEWDFSVTPNPDTHPGNPASWKPAPVPLPVTFDDYVNGYPTRASGAVNQEMEVATHLRLNQDLKLSGSFGGTVYNEIRAWWTANSPGMSKAERDQYFYERYLKDYVLTGRAIDRSVGDVLDFLEENDLDRNTIVIYASDQGFFLGEHGWYDKRWMYEESFRSPLLMQWKDENGDSRLAAGGTVDELVQIIDYAPTLLEAAGVEEFEPMHGQSFLGLATEDEDDEPESWRDYLYYHYYEGATREHRVPQHYGIYGGRYKLIFHYEIDEWEFFDLEEDPYELNNLFFDPETGRSDDPTDGISGDAAFQELVVDLMQELRAQRLELGDTTGPGFAIPGDPLEVIVFDSFEEFEGGVTRGDDQGAPGDLAWWLSGDASLGILNDSVFGGRVLAVTPPEKGTSIVGSFPPVSLRTTGDRLTLSLRYRQIDAVSGGMRFGLFGSDGTVTLVDDDGSADDDDGYILNVGTPGATGAGETRIMKQAGDADPVLTSGLDLGAALASGFRYGSRTVHGVTFEIERTGAAEMTLRGSWTGASAGSELVRVDSSDLLTEFDEIAIGFGSSGTPGARIRVDDIRLELMTVPLFLTSFEERDEGGFAIEFEGTPFGLYQLKGSDDLTFEDAGLVNLEEVELGEQIDLQTVRTNARGRGRVIFSQSRERKFVRVEPAQ